MSDYGWRGKPMLKISTKEVGTVVKDDNWGVGRTFTLKFKDGRTEQFTVANVGPTATQDYAWWFVPQSGAPGEWIVWSDFERTRVEGPVP